MKQIMWEIHSCSTPHILRYCKTCKTKTEYQSSGAFRVNAQKKSIDIWLIYKCIHCDSTWNMTIYTRTSPGSIPADTLLGFHENRETLAAVYANDVSLLLRNKAEPCPPDFTITGESIPLGIPILLTIKGNLGVPVKLIKILSKKMNLSQTQIQTLFQTGVMMLPDGHAAPGKSAGSQGSKPNKIRFRDEISLEIHLPVIESFSKESSS